jgi:hypothetical protein
VAKRVVAAAQRICFRDRRRAAAEAGVEEGGVAKAAAENVCSGSTVEGCDQR